MPRVFYSKSHPNSSDSNDALALQTSMYTRCVQGAYKMRTRTKINSLPLLMCKREKRSLAADVRYMLEPQWLRKIVKDPRLALGPTYCEQLTVG